MLGCKKAFKVSYNYIIHFSGHHVEMAERHGALLVALEHRFYGESLNPDGLETQQLKDLSSQQA